MIEFREAASHYLVLSEDELFALIVPDEGGVAYSEGGRTARGREIFRDLRAQVRSAVCPAYQLRRNVMGDSVDATLIVMAALIEPARVWGVPVLPLSALVVKLGLDVLCMGWKP